MSDIEVGVSDLEFNDISESKTVEKDDMNQHIESLPNMVQKGIEEDRRGGEGGKKTMKMI